MTAHPPEARSRLRSRSGLVLLAFLGIAGFFVITEHTAHFFGILPYLLLLACPLLHLFHGRHGAGHGDHGSGPENDGDGGRR